MIPDETDAPSGPGQLSIVSVFLVGLGMVLLFWWLASGDVPVKTLADWLNTIGRLTALIGTYLLLWQLVLLARLPWLEQAIGMDRLVWLHRWNAYAALTLITVHVVTQTVGYQLDDGFSTIRQLGDFIEHYEGLLPAIAGFVILIVVTVLSVEIARRQLAYETWYFVHLYSYLGVALAFSHQLATGADFINNPTFTAYWWALYALVFGRSPCSGSRCRCGGIRGTDSASTASNARPRARSPSMSPDATSTGSASSPDSSRSGASSTRAVGGRRTPSRCPRRRTASTCGSP